MALRAALAALFATRPPAHWVAWFDGVDACVTPVLTVDVALAHPSFVEAGVNGAIPDAVVSCEQSLVFKLPCRNTS